MLWGEAPLYEVGKGKAGRDIMLQFKSLVSTGAYKQLLKTLHFIWYTK